MRIPNDSDIAKKESLQSRSITPCYNGNRSFLEGFVSREDKFKLVEIISTRSCHLSNYIKVIITEKNDAIVMRARAYNQMVVVKLVLLMSH